MVTAATYEKEHFFSSDEKLDILTSSLLEIAEEFRWKLQAWAVFSNHYHFVGYSPPETGDLSRMIRKLHANTSRDLNRLEGVEGRKVWHQFRESQLTYERSYFARLHYVHQNPVKHGMTTCAADYPWCSEGWLLSSGDVALIETIKSFPIDRLNIEDDF